MPNAKLKEMYTQYCESARHVENERLEFTKMYVLIVTGVFVLVTNTILDAAYVWAFLLFLTILGFFVSHLTRIDHILFSRNAEIMAIKEFELPTIYQFYYTEQNKDVSLGNWRGILGSMSFMFHSFYILMTGLFTFLLSKSIINIFCASNIINFIVSLTVIIVMYILYFAVFRKKENDIAKELKNKLEV